MEDTQKFELYFAADTLKDAKYGLLWDSEWQAAEYARENGLSHVYAAIATVDYSTMREVQAVSDNGI